MPALVISGAVTMLQRFTHLLIVSWPDRDGTPRSAQPPAAGHHGPPRYGGRTCCARWPYTAPPKCGHGACGRCSWSLTQSQLPTALRPASDVPRPTATRATCSRECGDDTIERFTATELANPGRTAG